MTSQFTNTHCTAIHDIVIVLNQFMPSPSQRDAISRMLGAEEALVAKNDFIIEEETGVLRGTYTQ